MNPLDLHRLDLKVLAPKALVPWKEIRHMPRTLNRFLDAMAHITIVSFALYIGAATLGLGG